MNDTDKVWPLLTAWMVGWLMATLLNGIGWAVFVAALLALACGGLSFWAWWLTLPTAKYSDRRLWRTKERQERLAEGGK